MILSKGTVIACIFILFLSTSVFVNAEEPLATVNNYLEALKSGQTEVLIATLGGKLYDNRIGLLKKNKGYPEFLKNYYRDAEFTVLKIRPFDKNLHPPKNRLKIFKVGIKGESGGVKMKRNGSDERASALRSFNSVRPNNPLV